MSEEKAERQPLFGQRYYDASKNPHGAFLPGGVPMRDLSAEEFEAMPLWLQYTIDGSAFFRKTKPGRAKEAPRGESATDG